MLNKRLIYASIFCAAFSAHSYADDSGGSSVLPSPRPLESKSERRPHVGILAGAVDPEGSTGSQGTYGIEVGFQPYIPVGLALEVARTDTDALERTTALGKVTYNFGGPNYLVRHSYLGAVLGAAFERGGTYVASGPIIGFDLPTRDRESRFVSIGANARYVVLSKGDPDTAVGLNGVVKYWY